MVRNLKSQKRHFILKLAESEAELISAQRLRYRVFVQELGASGPTVDHENRLEADGFDAIYDHLLLIDRRRDAAELNHVVGVYRLLRGEVALSGPGFYSTAEYDLSPLLASGRRLLELGRSCVDRDHRGGIAVYLLWNALAEYVLAHDIEVLFGVASYHGTDVGRIAQSLAYLNQHHLAPKEMRARVRAPHYQRLDLVPPADLDRVAAMAQTPALIKAYLRLGGFIGDGAYIDRNFNTVDVCLMMDTAAMSARHKAAYTRRAEARV
jgi:L-ornithine Nalpha-acyltransferase